MIVSSFNESFLVDLNDPTLFGNDAAEEEDLEVLAAFYLDKPRFQQFWSSSRRLAVARSPKGVGKSAMLAKLRHDLSLCNPAPIVIHIDGADLAALAQFDSQDWSTLINQWRQAICTRINQELGARIGVAMSDVTMSAVEAAEVGGFRHRNMVRALIDRMIVKSRVPGPGGGSTDVALQRHVPMDHAQFLSRSIGALADSTVWLLVDDIDASFTFDQYNVSRTASFLSACRKLIRDVDGLNIRATIRTGVWSLISTVEDLDKAEQYMLDIAWSHGDITDMLSRRIYAYIQRTNPCVRLLQERRPGEHPGHLIGLLFHPKMKWGGFVHTPTKVVNLLSGRRPRWMCQLCRTAAARAAVLGPRRQQELIVMDDIQAVMPRYSAARVLDLEKEHGHRFTDFPGLLSIFVSGPPKFSTQDLLDRIYHMYLEVRGDTSPPLLDGKPIRSTLMLARLLYQVGFLIGELDAGFPDVHYFTFDEHPYLMHDSTSAIASYTWGISPPYRHNLRVH